MEKKSALVLSGGISHEREVSLRSGRRVADALADRGWAVTTEEPDAHLLAGLAPGTFDVVWPALHGASGEDGALRALLELKGVAFVGADHRAARLAWDKPAAKTLVERSGVRTPRSVALTRDTFRELGAPAVLELIRSRFEVPLIVKPARGGSAQGVSIVRDVDALARAMVEAYTYGDDALIEDFVEGTEVAVSVIDSGEGPFALPAVEIEPLSGEYDYEARYNAGETRFYAPARLDERAADAATDAAIAVHKTLGLRHLSRVDFIVDSDGTPWFLEVNVLPGLTETSLLPQAVRAGGFDLGEVYEALASAAIADR